MKFLCLPGAYGSAKNFKVQLGPLAEELEKRGLATFSYSQGQYEVDPPAGWEDYFGQRPLYRFLDTSKGDTFETLRKLRYIPRGLCPENTMRLFQGASEGADWHQKAWRDALDAVFRTIAEDPEIDGIIGYSEGAMVAASVVVEEAWKAKTQGTPQQIKYGIFIAGAPPLKFDGATKIVTQLADEVGTVINIPTFHIFGCDDAFLSSATALFNVCEPTTATMYDHGLGHIVPRDAPNVKQLADMFEQLLPKIHQGEQPASMKQGVESTDEKTTLAGAVGTTKVSA